MNYSISIVQRKTKEQEFDESWKRERHRLNTDRSLVTGFLLGVFSALTPCAFTYADMVREYNGTGGEIMVPVLGLLLWMVNVEYFEAEKRKVKRSLMKKYLGVVR